MTIGRTRGWISVLVIAAACHKQNSFGGQPDGALATADASHATTDAGADASSVTRFDAPPGTVDASTADRAAPVDAGVDSNTSCSLVGTWTGTVNGGLTDVSWTFNSDGTASGTFTTGASVVTDNGPWAVSNGDITFSTSSCSPSNACPCSGDGVYALTFSADCNSATTTLVTDACPGRDAFVDGLSLDRQ
jgi:hypothetical protein